MPIARWSGVIRLPFSPELLLGNPANLPYRARIEVGPETLDLLVTACMDTQQNYTGPMVTWSVVTEKLRLEAAAARSRSARKAIGQLHESANEIGKITKVISNVAKQTNLLGLNATIEAARVGVAGRGFAVVATHVKELANETAKATAEVAARITDIQQNAAEVVHAVEEINNALTTSDSSSEFEAAAD